MSSRLSVLVAVVTVTAGLAGCAAPSEGPAGDRLGQATLAPGTSANLAIVVHNVSEEPEDGSVHVADSGEVNATLPDSLEYEGETLAGWLSVSVPEDAPNGSTAVVLGLGPEDSEAREVHVSIEVEPVGDGLSRGATAMIDLTARNEAGEIALTTNRTVAESPLPKSADFQQPRQFQPIPVQLSQRTQLPGALVSAVAQSAVNHSLSVDVPEAFGPAELERNTSRTETIQRERTDQRFVDLPKQRAQQQGLVPPDAEEGDEIDLPNSPLPYRIDNVNQTHVRIGVNVTEGENVTVYDAWSNASKVTNVTDDEVTFRTDPDIEPGERFTWREEWPNATEIVKETNTTIELRHTPEEGSTYTQQTRRGQPTTITVVSVEPDQIVLSQDNPNPLGGQTITFDVTVLSEQAPQRQPRGGGGPR